MARSFSPKPSSSGLSRGSIDSAPARRAEPRRRTLSSASEIMDPRDKPEDDEGGEE